MKKSIIALVLSIVMVVGSAGGSSVLAAETTAEEAVPVEETKTEEEADEVTFEEENAVEEEADEVSSEGENTVEEEAVEENTSSDETKATDEEIVDDIPQEEPEEAEKDTIETDEPEYTEENKRALSSSATEDSVAQAIWTGSTFTFYYGPEFNVGGTFNGKEVDGVWSGSVITNTGNSMPKWTNSIKAYVKNVVFDTSFLQVKPTSMNCWFHGLYKLESVDVSGLDTSDVTNMCYVFSACWVLSSLDVSGFNTSNVTDMSGMFTDCTWLTTLDVSGFDTSKVTNMCMMFNGCKRLNGLDVSGFDTSNVTSMRCMFYDCNKVTNLDVSGFDTSNVTDMYRMFTYCSNVTSIDVSSFDTSNLKKTDQMFSSCSKLKTIYCKDSSTNWCILGESLMFHDCESLVGTSGGTRITYDSNKVDASMAKAANLGGYFTPKTADITVQYTGLDNVLHLGKIQPIGALINSSDESVDVNAEAEKIVWSIEDTKYATIEKLGSVVGNAVQLSIDAKHPGKTKLIATLSNGDVISKEIIIEPKMVVSVGAKLNNGKIDEIDNVISYSNVWCMVSLEGYEADKDYLNNFIQNVTYNEEEIKESVDIIKETPFVSEDGFNAWIELRINPKSNRSSQRVHTVFLSPEKARADKYFNVQKDLIAELYYRPNGEKWSGSGHHSFFFSDDFFYRNSTAYYNDLAVLSLGLELSAMTTPGYEDQYTSTVESGRESNLSYAFKSLGFKNPIFNKYDTPLNDFSNYAAFGIAKKTISDKEHDDTLIAVAIRGGGYGAEWASNFDLEDSGDALGFRNAADYALVVLKQYIDDLKKSGDVAGDIKVWVVGFSRGAAIANILGHRINEKGMGIDVSSAYVYTFATPSGQRGNDHSDNNIFNIVSSCDLVPRLPLSDWGFSKYGVTNLIVGRYDNEYVGNSFKNFTGEDFKIENSGYLVNCFESLMGALVPEFEDYRNKAQSDFVDAFKKHYSNGESGKGMALSFGKGLFGVLCNSASYDLTKFTGDELNKIKTLWDFEESMVNLSSDISEAQVIMNKAANEQNNEQGLKRIWKFFKEFAKEMSITSIEQAHYPEHYLAWLESGGIMTMDTDTYANLDQSDRDKIERSIAAAFNDELTKLISIECPVDVTVYTSSGKVVGKIVDDTVITDDIPCYVAGDAKRIYFPAGDNYRIELTGTDSGKMDYSVMEFSKDFNILREVQYYNVDLSPGIEYETEINDNVLDQSVTYAMTNGDVTTVPAIDTLSGIEEPYYTLSVAGGEAEHHRVMDGEEVAVYANIPENDTFAKWISDDPDVYFDNPDDENTTVRIPARDTTITAHFASEHKWNNEYTVDVEPGETEPGYESIHCSICDEIREGSQIEIPSIEDNVVIDSGTCGDNLTWTLIKNGTLTITGTGEMENYISFEPPAWNKYRNDIKRVVLKQGVTSIGSYACFMLSNLSSVSISNSVNTINRFSFCRCHGLQSITFPEGVEKLDGQAFQSCDGLKEVILPSSLKEYGDNPFSDCPGLNSITISPNNLHFNSIDGVLYNKEGTELFRYPSGREGVFSIPASVTKLRGKSFSCCHKITSLTIPKSIKTIGAMAFDECSNLSTVYYIGTREEWESIEIEAQNKALTDATIVFIDNPSDLKYAEVTGLLTQKYTGKPITPTPSVKQLGVELEEGKDYTVSYLDNVNAGKATVTISGTGDYTGIVSASFTVSPKSISGLTVSGIAAKTYTGKAQTQAVVMKDGDTTLKSGSDYTVTYKNNINAGTASVVITGKGNYEGSVTKTFTIKKAANKITAKNFTKTYSKKAQSFALGAKATSGTPTYSSNKKKVTVSKAGKVTVKAKFIGKATITITAPATANYSKTIKKITITVKPTKTALSSVSSPSAGKMKVKWKKNTVGTGYQIQFSTSAKFKSAKSAWITKNTTTVKTISKLKKGKKYYVRIRTYKKVGKVKYYSGWSKTKAVKVKK